jgi:L-lactate dehydrogenase complex protein LldF
MGGHAYASVYSGPIGAVLSPLLAQSEQARELANASTLCGACFEACPVKIPLHDMLVRQRARNVRGSNGLERWAFRAYATLFSSPRLFRLLSGVGRALQRALIGDGSRSRWLTRRVPALFGWTRYRALPLPAKRSFRERFSKR